MATRLLLSLGFYASLFITAYAGDTVGMPLAAWQPGMLDIHQISSGRGNAGLYVLPDGTTLLVDAGELPIRTPFLAPSGRMKTCAAFPFA